MNTNDKTKLSIVDLVSRLYEHLHIGEPPEDALYSSVNFYLDEEGYQSLYFEVLRALYTISGITEIWSERALKDQLHWLLVKLAEAKEVAGNSDQTSINFSSLATIWLERFQSQFEKQNYYIPVTGLEVEKPLTIGSVTFWPWAEKLTEIEQQDPFHTYADLPAHSSCLVGVRIAAEAYKAVEIMRQRVEEALNVLRYLGALVWYNQPTRHIYLAGTEPGRVSYVLTWDGQGRIDRLGDSLYWPIPFQVDNTFLNRANNYGLRDLSAWIDNPEATPLQKLLVNSIQWFGDATQELAPLQAFMKYYVAMESLLKKGRENAKKVVPKRVACLLGERDREKRQLEIELLIEERNEVFHRGSPKEDPPELLEWVGHQFARNMINKILPMASSYGFSTKEEFLCWVDKSCADRA